MSRYKEMREQDLERRENRRRPKSSPPSSQNWRSSLSQIRKEMPKETPPQYVARLWNQRRELAEKLEDSGPDNVYRLSKRISALEDKVAKICEERRIPHPGIA